MKLTLLTLLFLLSLQLPGRENNIFKYWDTTRINQKLKLYNESTNKSTLQPLLDSIIVSSTLLNYEEGLAKAYYHKGRRYSSISKTDSAIIYFHQAKNLFDKKMNVSESGKGSILDYSIETRRQIAFLYLWRKRNAKDSALYYLNQALSLNIDNYFSPLNSTTFSFYCQYYTKISQMDSAIAFAKRAITADPENLIAYDELGKSYGRSGNSAKALESFLEGYNRAKRANNEHMIAHLASNIGFFYSNHGEYEKAIPYREIALEYNLKYYPKSSNYVSSLDALGTIYLGVC